MFFIILLKSFTLTTTSIACFYILIILERPGNEIVFTGICWGSFSECTASTSQKKTILDTIGNTFLEDETNIIFTGTILISVLVEIVSHEAE